MSLRLLITIAAKEYAECAHFLLTVKLTVRIEALHLANFTRVCLRMATQSISSRSAQKHSRLSRILSLIEARSNVSSKQADLYQSILLEIPSTPMQFRSTNTMQIRLSTLQLASAVAHALQLVRMHQQCFSFRPKYRN